MTIHVFGIFAAILTLVLLGLGHFGVVWFEKNFHISWTPVVFMVGLVLLVLSAFIRNDCLSSLIGLTGVVIIWGSLELKDQAKRSKLGWYPSKQKKVNPPWHQPKGN